MIFLKRVLGTFSGNLGETVVKILFCESGQYCVQKNLLCMDKHIEKYVICVK